MSRIKAGVIVFPGTNCDIDTKRACEFFGWDTDYVWHDETGLDKYDAVFLPGGFSYGDYIRAGRLAKFSPVVKALKDYKGFVAGICNGFQILCETGLLPGILSNNTNTKFICEEVPLEFNGQDIKWAIAHGEGRYIADENTTEDMILLKYKNNPNGSDMDIAGLYDRENRVIGMMPHPERGIFAETGNTDGRAFFEFLEKELSLAQKFTKTSILPICQRHRELST